MDENDTFKRLKGMTHSEAMEIFASIYEDLISENKSHSNSIQRMTIKQVVDAHPELKYHGWTFNRILSAGIFEGESDDIS